MKRLVLGIAVAVTSLVPAVGMADDHQIAEYVKSRLKSEQEAGNLKGFNVDMRVDGGTVWFEGFVSNKQQQMTILRTAQQAGHLGVVQVVDDIEVRHAKVPQSAAPVYSAPAYSAPATYQKYAPAPALSVAAPTAPVQAIESVPVIEPVRAIEAIPTVQSASYREPVVTAVQAPVQQVVESHNEPLPFAACTTCGPVEGGEIIDGGSHSRNPVPAGYGGQPGASGPANLPGYAWPAYAASPNYGAVSYPRQHSASAWPYIGPFYPYPQVPLGWRKVTLEWDDGWWHLDFQDK